MSGDGDTLADYWRDVRGHQKHGAGKRRKLARQQMPEAQALAVASGLEIRQNSESHFTLSRPGVWRVELYPGNQRIYRGQQSAAPFLKLDHLERWSIIDCIKAAVAAEERAP